LFKRYPMIRTKMETIVQSPEFTYGFTTDSFVTFQLLEKIYTSSELSELLYACSKEPVNGLNIIKKYKQYIILFHILLNNDFSGSICFVHLGEGISPLSGTYPRFPKFRWTEKNKKEFDQLLLNTDWQAMVV